MDFAGGDGLDALPLLSSDNHNNNNNNSAFDFKLKHQQLSLSTSAHPDDLLKTMLLRSNNNTGLSDSQNMLSFSSPCSPPLHCHTRNISSYGLRGPFTPTQWMELEHQALIYKYISVNAPIPSNLLIPIRKALETAAFCSFPGTNLRHAAYGWGGFHMGFSNNSDPEPGRCRRTDGKKWRCSRDAVADQKYCERHMNRGRHRSRKPVEGQTGHSVNNGRTINTTTTAAAVVSTPVTTAAATVSRLNQQTPQHINRRMGFTFAIGLSGSRALLDVTNLIVNLCRNFIKNEKVTSDKIQDSTVHSMLSPSSIGLKQEAISVPSEFGFVCSDSLLNPLHKTDNLGQKPPNSLHQFMDDWPNSDKPHFISSNSSPGNERLNLSPLRMGLGVGNATAHHVFDEMSKPGSWIPVLWDSSSGGPLGEVLNHSTNNGPSALNLMTDGWDSSQHTTLSPTGVLQKTGFGCFSNSSAGSSP
ncbi:growth-regulating factor 6-like [Bidens hawaiensis]|uniref:growth-regulating factor 6-like n=1 Tax=Bidens hawaiensis TaxID=980011 RepID=UPI0040495E7A